ncbi:MAG: hypothetical protein NTV02_03345 [Candidatus Zambryskibacteria bacterium]|nr:hypothetical protein [Candidatus Zambryskibacteria bacterium]
MPSEHETLRLLFTETKPFSDEVWIQLLEARRKTMMPHLNSFTLPTLGGVKCVEINTSYRDELTRSNPEVTGEKELDLQVQGIFRPSLYASRVVYPKVRGQSSRGRFCIWGLSRKGEWVVATVFYEIADSSNNRREYACRVDINKVDLPKLVEICKCSYEEVWRELGKEVSEWHEKRRELYRIINRLNTQFNIEDSLRH